MPAPSRSTVTSSVTAAGDSVTTGSKTATGGLLSSRPCSAFTVTSSPAGSVHSSMSDSATPRTQVTSYDAGTSPFGQMAVESASANPVHSHDRDPLVTGPGSFFRTGASFGPTNRVTMLPPPLRPNFLGEYGRGVSGCVPPLIRETSDLFRLTASTCQPPATGEPQESLREGIATRQWLEMSARQTAAVITDEERYSHSTNGLPMVGEPQEEPEVAFDIDRQLRDPIEALQTVPHVDACPRHPLTCTTSEDDGATALQDKHIAKYEARLQNRQARASAAYDAGCRDPDPVATTSTGLLRGAGHGYLLHPDRVSQPSRQAADTVDSPWACHQQRAHRLTNSQP